MEQEIMTSDEAARYLRIGTVTLKKKAREGSIPAAKIGRAWRFQKRDLDSWLDAGGDLPEELVDWALVELAKERMAEAEKTGEKAIPWEQVRKDYGL